MTDNLNPDYLPDLRLGKRDKDTMVAVTPEDRELGFYLSVWKTSDGDALSGLWEGRYDNTPAMQRIARHRISALTSDGGRDGFEAEHDNDTFTIRFPDGHAITAWDDGRLIVTKAEPGFAPFAVNVAALAQPVEAGEDGT